MQQLLNSFSTEIEEYSCDDFKDKEEKMLSILNVRDNSRYEWNSFFY